MIEVCAQKTCSKINNSYSATSVSYQVLYPAHYTCPSCTHLHAIALVSIYQPKTEIVLCGQRFEQFELDRVFVFDIVFECCFKQTKRNNLKKQR